MPFITPVFVISDIENFTPKLIEQFRLAYPNLNCDKYLYEPTTRKLALFFHGGYWSGSDELDCFCEMTDEMKKALEAVYKFWEKYGNVAFSRNGNCYPIMCTYEEFLNILKTKMDGDEKWSMFSVDCNSDDFEDEEYARWAEYLRKK